MAEVSKQARHTAELLVFGCRHEAGVHAMRDLLYLTRDEINTRWPNLEGEELSRLQGEAKMVARLINLIEQGPKIKQTERGE